MHFSLIATLSLAACALAAPTPKDELRLIRVNEVDEPTLMTEDEVLELAKKEIGFMDVTDGELTPLTDGAARIASSSVPDGVAHQKEVNRLISLIDTDNQKAFIQKEASFRNRYFRSNEGKSSSDWIRSHAREIADRAGSSVRATVREFTHSWAQSSVIATLEPASRSSLPRVVIGGHMDTLSGTMPGADDDSSGTSTVMEVFRVLIEGGFVPDRPIDFMFYAAEEVGLRGSQDIARSYQNDGVAVRGALQVDMTGYTSGQEVIGVVTDYTDDELSAFLRKLIRQYSGLPIKNFTCRYGCSDHASWNRAGYRAVFPFETGSLNSSNRKIHTSGDVESLINYEHAAEFTKVAVGFAVEMTS